MLRDYPKMEGKNIKYYVKMAIINLLHANSCVHSRILIAEFPEYGIKCMEKLLTTAFKSKMIIFKLDEDPLQRRIYFITFIDSLNMVFHNIEKLMKCSEIIQK